MTKLRSCTPFSTCLFLILFSRNARAENAVAYGAALMESGRVRLTRRNTMQKLRAWQTCRSWENKSRGRTERSRRLNEPLP